MADRLALVFADMGDAQMRQESLSLAGGYPKMAVAGDEFGNGTHVALNEAGTFQSTLILENASTGEFGIVVDGDEVRACAQRYGSPIPFDLLTPQEQAEVVPVDASWFPSEPGGA